MLGMKRTDGNLAFLYAVYLAALAVGNVLDNSYVILFHMTLPASVLAYPITLLITCIICELWEEEDASRLVLLGLAVKFVGVVLLGLAQLMTLFPDYGARQELWSVLGTSFWEVSGQMVLGDNIRFWSMSIISFACAQFTGIFIFDALLDRHILRTGGPWGGRWLRYLTACMAGEATETILFALLNFSPEWEKVMFLTRTQLYARGLMTLATLPLFYALTWRRRMKWRKVRHV